MSTLTPPRATPRTTHTTTRRAEQQAVLRLARRTLRDGGWRNALVIALIALAVAAAVATAIGIRSTRLPDDVWLLQQMGAVADLRVEHDRYAVRFDDLPAELRAAYVDLVGAPPPQRDLPPVEAVVEQIAPGTPVLPLVDTPGEGLLGVRVLAVDLADPLAEGLVGAVSAQPGPGEVVLTPAAAERLDAGVGDEVALAGRSGLRVVGTAEPALRPSEAVAVLAPGELGEPTTWLLDADADAPRLAAALEAPSSAEPMAATHRWVLQREVRDPVTGAPLEGPAALEASRTSLARRIAEDPSAIGTLVGALLLLQVGLVAAAAFATGTRRRVRAFGLLASAGAAPGQVVRVVLGEALLLGGLGALAGAAIGAGAVAAGQPLLERIADARVEQLAISPLDLAGPALVGVAAAVLAALWPARTLGRTPVTTALAGRVPTRSIPGWLPATAVASVILGLLMLGVAVTGMGFGASVGVGVGGILTTSGAAALGVPLLALAGRTTGRLPVLPRLVIRDAVRQRTRSGAAVAALVVVLLIPALLLTAQATSEAGRGGPVGEPDAVVEISGPYLDPVPLPVTEAMVADVRALLPVEPVRQVDLPQLVALDDPRGEQPPALAIADQVPGASRYAPLQGSWTAASPAVLDDLQVGRTAREALAGGQLVELVAPGLATDAQLAADRRVRVAATGQEVALSTVEHDLPLVHQVLLVPAEVVEAAGLAPVDTRVLLELPRLLTIQEADPIIPAGRAATSGGSVHVPIQHDGTADAVFPLVVLGVPLLVALIVVGMTTALAATESDRDLAAMTAVGADPRMRRRFHGLQSAYHTLLAAVIAVPTALLLQRVVSTVQRATSSGYTAMEAPVQVVPWLGLLAIVAGIPAIVGLVLWAVMRPARPLTGRRVT